MLEINCRLDSRAVACSENITEKAKLLEKIAYKAQEAYNLPYSDVLDGLIERENLGSTGFGGGIAIPHCKIDTVKSPLGVFLHLPKALDYGSVDEQPVDLIFSLISPRNDGAAHLRALAEVSRLLRDEKSCAQLRGAKNEDALFALLAVNSERNAA